MPDGENIPADKKPLHILIVEDDSEDALIIKDLLREGIRSPRPVIEHLPSGLEALSRLVESCPYDVGIFDYRLGETDGIELLRTIRAKGLTLPIIFLTGQGDQEVAVEAMKSGATDYLVKTNLSSDQLCKTIRYGLTLHQEELHRREAENMLKKSHENLVKAHEELQESMRKLQAAQNQILRSEKLASIGRLSAGVCHEILNPLNIISGHVQVLMMERGNDLALQEDLGSIAEEVTRIEKIVGGLLKFSRKRDIDLKNTDLNKELDSVLAITEKEMSLDNIAVVRRFEKLPRIRVDSDRMRQVFLNIINNAKHAMERGGTLTVQTEYVVKDALGEVQPVAPDADRNRQPDNERRFIRIRFIDTGTGIKKENMSKLFDPFFTTKPEDKGTGLGLSVCYSIIEKHGGTIEAESEYGRGATFIIDLPATGTERETMENPDEDAPDY
jgi:signal transduction histidine kinase